MAKPFHGLAGKTVRATQPLGYEPRELKRWSHGPHCTQADGVQSTRHSPSDELRLPTPQAGSTQSTRHSPSDELRLPAAQAAGTQSTHHSPSDELRLPTPQADGVQSTRHSPSDELRLPTPQAGSTRRVPATLGYAAFTPTITTKDQIKPTIESALGLPTKHAAFQKAIGGWWKKNLAKIERLPETKNVFELRLHCIDSLAKTLTSQGILTGHQARGSVAAYFKTLEIDLQSIAASGWGGELIPEEQNLQSQFPEVLVQIEKDQTRIAELEGLFAAANATEEEDADRENVDTETGVLPKALTQSKRPDPCCFP